MKKYSMPLIYTSSFIAVFMLITIMSEVSGIFLISSLWVGLIVAILFMCKLFLHFNNKKKFRSGIEHGSATWAKPEEAKNYMVYVLRVSGQ